MREELCFISPQIREHERKKVRKRVCSHLEANYKDETDNFYCVLHFPSKDKKEDFKVEYDNKLGLNDFNFQWSYFPDNLFLADKTIEVKADFSNAAFTENVYLIKNHFKNEVSFYGAIIEGDFDVRDTKFDSNTSFQETRIYETLSLNRVRFQTPANFYAMRVCGRAYFSINSPTTDVNFQFARFCNDVSFKSCVFNEASFISTAFFGEATFDEAIFSSEARFDSCKFAKDVTFRKAQFKYICVFDSCYFHEVADFTRAEFHNFAHFEEAKFAIENSLSDWNYGGYFDECRFHGYVSFNGSKFKFANFYSSEFKKTIYLKNIEIYEEGNFESSIFDSEVDFRDAQFFRKVSLGYSEFKGAIKFAGSSDNKVFSDILDLQHIEIDKSEKVYFHTVNLRPGWFINSDCKKFVFTACTWKMPDGKSVDTKTELRELEERKIPNSNELLTKSCWQLADNHEETKSFPEASLFRRMAFESERLSRRKQFKNWKTDIGKIFTDKTKCKNIISATSERTKRFSNLVKSSPLDFVHFSYYWLSGYGEKWFRAFAWLLFIWVFFAVLYWLIGTFGSSERQEFIGFWKSFGYSLQVMTLQRPEPRPFSTITLLFYGLETILAPLQAALLALAIRRKFMR